MLMEQCITIYDRLVLHVPIQHNSVALQDCPGFTNHDLVHKWHVHRCGSELCLEPAHTAVN